MNGECFPWLTEQRNESCGSGIAGAGAGSVLEQLADEIALRATRGRSSSPQPGPGARMAFMAPAS
jgi:hypothetical protein